MSKWTIHIDDNVTIIGDFITNTPAETNLLTRGDTATYEFVEVTPRLTVAAGDTVTIEAGETVEKALVVVDGTLIIDGTLRCDELENNGTITNNGTIDVNEKYELAYDDVRPYAEYAGQFALFETLDSRQAYAENIPPNSQPETLLVGVEPQASLQNGDLRGYWGLVTNLTDTRNISLSNGPRIELEITILAPYSEYQDHTAVENALKV